MPVNCQATAITGILMLGKISVGVRKIMIGIRTKMSTARTMKVYGRSRASRTIHITRTPYTPIAESTRDLMQSGQCNSGMRLPNEPAIMRTESLRRSSSDIGLLECGTNREGKATSQLRSARQFRYRFADPFHCLVVSLSLSLNLSWNCCEPAAKYPGREGEFRRAGHAFR